MNETDKFFERHADYGVTLNHYGLTEWVSVVELYRHFAERMLREQQQAMAAELESCARLCEGEKVDAEASWQRDDFAYNAACRDCADAIRRKVSASRSLSRLESADTGRHGPNRLNYSASHQAQRGS